MTRPLGTVVFDAKKRGWKVTPEPHVAIRLKRVFGKLARSHSGTLFLSDSDENARDLQWFLERYPMDVQPAALLEERAAAYRERASFVEGLLSGYVPPRAFDLAIPLREYQRIGADLALRTGGLLIADDVGIGKTAQAIAVCTEPDALPALVVTLAHLPIQWEAEFNRFAPGLRTHVIRKAQPYDLRLVGPAKKQLRLMEDALPDVLIVNYHKLAGWSNVFPKLVRTVIFDEAQELRRTESQKYAAAAAIASAARYRLGLSATPIFNWGSEFHSVSECLRPGALGTHTEFVTEWCVGYSGKERVKDPKAFGTYLRESGLMIRRTRADVGRELPPLSKAVHMVESDPEALHKVGHAADELARIILSKTTLEQGARWEASEHFSNMLRQATGIAKAPYVAEFVRLLLESGERVVLFGWHRAVYELWLDRLKDFSPVLYTGSESATQKEASKKAFVDGESPLLIMSLRAGAGLDGLQHVSRTVVFGELDWSPAVHEQNTGRVFRDGQKDPVVAYYLVSETGADPAIVDVLGLKKAQADGIRDPHGSILETAGDDVDRVKALAESYLRQRGMPLPADAPAAEAAAEELAS